MEKASTRATMTVRMRAKQFAMFDALKGLTEAIAEKERQTHSFKLLSEERIAEIDQQLKELEVGDYVSVIYYCWYGRQYREMSGKVNRIDSFWRGIQIDEVNIGFDEIFEINEFVQS